MKRIFNEVGVIFLFVLIIACGKKDTTPPTVRILEPVNNASLPAKDILIKVEATDEAGIDRVEFWIDGAKKREETSGVGDTFRYTWDATNVSSGIHAIVAKAFDEAGNYAQDSIAVNITAPYPRRLIATIDLLPNPQSIDITPGGSEIWVNHWGQTDTFVYVISTATNQVTHRIPVTNVGDNELRITKDGSFAYYCGLWNLDSAGILELSTAEYKQKRILGYLEYTPPVKTGPRGYGIALTQTNDYIYAANMGDPADHGCITKFNVSTGDLVDSLHLPWVYDIDLNHSETKLYAVSQDADLFYEIDPNDLSLIRQLPVGNGPEIILITNDDRYAFISHLNDSVYLVDLNNWSVVKKFDPGIGEFGMAFTPDEKYLFLCDRGSRYISVFDLTNPINPIMVEKLEFPDAGSFTELVFNLDGSRAYLVESHGHIYVLGK